MVPASPSSLFTIQPVPLHFSFVWGKGTKSTSPTPLECGKDGGMEFNLEGSAFVRHRENLAHADSDCLEHLPSKDSITSQALARKICLALRIVGKNIAYSVPLNCADQWTCRLSL